MARLKQFLRSVIPADPAQLFFLGGAVCLIISPHLRWWPPGWRMLNAQFTNFPSGVVGALGAFLPSITSFSGIAAYFVCFWPGPRPARRILYFVLIPAVIGLCLTFAWTANVTDPGHSVLESRSDFFAQELHWLRSLPWTSLTGFHFWAVGVGLVAAFQRRLRLQQSSLPLSLSGFHELAAPYAWKRFLFLIWFVIGPLFVCTNLLLLLRFISWVTTGSIPFFVSTPWLPLLISIASGSVMICICLAIVDRDDRRTLLALIRSPGEKGVILAIFFPVLSEVALSFGQYAFARIQWAAESYYRSFAPEIRSYFNAPDALLIILLFPALLEELVFRGLIQPRFVERYGLYRGVFLVSMVWAAFHFASDFSFSHASDLDVAVRLTYRILMCVALSFVFAWLTLQSRSIFPAGIAHGLYNISVYSNLGQPFPGKQFFRVFLWAALASVLFRYWPPASTEPAQGPPNAEPVPAPSS